MSLEIHVLAWNCYMLCHWNSTSWLTTGTCYVIGNPSPGLQLVHVMALEIHVLAYNWHMLCHWKSTSWFRTGTCYVIGNSRPGLELVHNMSLEIHFLASKFPEADCPSFYIGNLSLIIKCLFWILWLFIIYLWYFSIGLSINLINKQSQSELSFQHK
jgi:hypothetical protein